MQEMLTEKKKKTRQATSCFLGLGGKIVDIWLDTMKINDDPSFESKFQMMGKVEILNREKLEFGHGNLPNSQLFIMGYIDKMVLLLNKLSLYQAEYRQTVIKLSPDQSALSFDSKDFFLELVDTLYKEKDDDWFKSCK